MNEIVIKQDKKKAIQMVALGIFMLLLCVSDLLIGIIEKNIFYISVGIMATIFFGICLIFIIKSAVTSKTLLIISDEGITDMSTMSSVGIITWDEIESINAKRIFTEKFIGITVYDIDKIMNRISSSKQMAIRVNMKLNYPPIGISLNTANLKFDYVLSLMQARLEEYRNNKEAFKHITIGR